MGAGAGSGPGLRASRRGRVRGVGLASALIGALALAGCETTPAPKSAPPRPAPAAAPATAPSEASRAMKARLARIQMSLLAHGLLRTDGGGADAPFDAESLARDFMEIALKQEYSERDGRLVAMARPSTLHRWESPVRYLTVFGASVPPAQRTRDQNAVTQFMQRLARLTRLSITPAPRQEDANFFIFFVNEDERRALGPRLRAIEPGISPATLAAAVDMAPDTYCLAFASDPDEDGAHDRAIAIIRAEHPDLLRLSCIHEELAQAMGLANDSPRARPSIFNDDEEFALLTTHDELLLRMLYDPRLRPGMTAREAWPIVRQIAAELVGGGQA